ncbi:MAG: phosphotransferase [Bacteroidales bacterium]|nr:phosphotransferase [Bacteroidales bacterium]
MSDQSERQTLAMLFEQWSGLPCAEILALGAQGSSRRYYRLTAQPWDAGCQPANDGTQAASLRTLSAIGTVGDDLRENRAFFALDRHLRAKGIRVPELYAVAPDERCYLQQDLGDLSLYGLLHEKQRQGGGFDAEMLAFYKQALADLAAIQQAGADFDFSYSYPRADFDRQSILWDLNYFKYHYLKLAHVAFDEQLLEDDFQRLADLLLQADTHYLLYRDFQTRNIMVVERVNALLCECVSADAPATNAITQSHNNALLYYIDFQGARRGAAQYDVASILYSAKSNLPEPIRRELLAHYLRVRGIKGDERRRWLDHFWAYLLLRILQTLGAYGYRGIFERKEYFLQSIPLALQNLRRLAEDHPQALDGLPHLKQIVEILTTEGLTPAPLQGRGEADAGCGRQNPSPLERGRGEASEALTVTVLSFSYKQGLPEDPSGNGGGFVFDCRALPNPGRYSEYKAYTGKDRPVIEFLQKEPPVDEFLGNVKRILAQSVDKYRERHFTSLQVAFGCTGGQHRSVYCAEQTARWLRETYPDVAVALRHREQDTPRKQ